MNYGGANGFYTYSQGVVTFTTPEGIVHYKKKPNSYEDSTAKADRLTQAFSKQTEEFKDLQEKYQAALAKIKSQDDDNAALIAENQRLKKRIEQAEIPKAQD